MFHTVAFAAALATTNVGSLCTPVVDNTISINGNNLLVPDKVNQLFAAIAFQTTGTSSTLSQIQAPSLRETFFPSLSPLVNATTPDANAFIADFFDNPIPLQTNEGLNYQDAATATTAGDRGAVVFLSDGKRTPARGGKVFTMQASATITQVARTWVNGPLTFQQTLPVGSYDVVGMRVEAASGMAARLAFIGQSAPTRPGCPINASAITRDIYDFRRGNLGVWGTFYSLTPPSLDVFSGTATAQVVYLDLVQR